MRTTYDHIKQVISENFPETMLYRKAANVRVGKGKTRRRIRRRVGISSDNAFSLEIFGKDSAIHWIKFMVVANDITILSRNLVPIRAVIESIFPDWEGGDEMGRQAILLPDGGKKTTGNVVLKRIDLDGNRFLLVTVR